MKKANVFLLAAGYLAGLAVALRFNKKSHEEFERELAASDEKYKTFGSNIFEIHKNLFETVETSVFSEENKKRVEEYKEKLLSELDLFQKEAEVKIQEWKLKGMGKKDEIEAELRDLYTRRREILEQIREKGLNLADDAKENGKDITDEGKKMAIRLFEESKTRLDKGYEMLKNKLGK